MDMRLKIIVVVFVVIAILYGIHFMLTYMGKKKETFVDDLMEDDVEHYEDVSKPTKESDPKAQESKYAQRILVLDDIEKLHITDKEVKGKLIEYVFMDTVFDDLTKKTSSERYDAIEKKYQELQKEGSTQTPPPPVPSSPPQPSSAPLSPTVPSVPQTQTNPSSIPAGEPVEAPKLPEQDQKREHLAAAPTQVQKTSMDADLVKKTQEALNHLQYVENGLNEIHNYARNIKIPYKEPMLPDFPKLHDPVKDMKELIEGFENVQSYGAPW